MVEYTVRQINAFAANSPFPGSDAQMDFALVTGDHALKGGGGVDRCGGGAGRDKGRSCEKGRAADV